MPNKKAQKLSRAVGAANTFEAVAVEYIAKKREGRAPVTLAKSRWLSKRLSAPIGRLPITDITVEELRVPLRIAEQDGAL